jgi:3-phenylpropionate/trans-cinnamate dioxygenase ferredoxin subunit
MATIQIGTTADVPENSIRGVRFVVDGTIIAVFRVGDAWYAIDDTCSHADASLAEGDFDSDELCVECPLHGSMFDLRTGRPRTLPAFEPVKTYKVWAEGIKLFLDNSA